MKAIKAVLKALKVPLSHKPFGYLIMLQIALIKVSVNAKPGKQYLWMSLPASIFLKNGILI
ncbi:hypothetical protein [Mucilaginibacter phyllosphaerae]|uniref:Uncharacterized protein n=1 Tax=Mucilaginibacter phyllosphaerae TaxID=1812349 RepID=A0A4Y8A8N0_9SPHI|nr:hypothetical protein [Mucilaginibacter phyllosphaerae]MBB3970837.1 hypothetical protein [Mucilaginibacter phyllosphaerae]TEW64227.1 hypothetical protein E2R65_17925 [Mucilaginibacter phyllosphaerae]